MATSAVAPAAPAAPSTPAAAPSTAPVSTPASTTVETPSTTVVSTPATPATPAAATPAKPVPADFSNITEYLDAVHKHDREHPDDPVQAPQEQTAKPVDKPAEQTEDAEHKLQDGVDPEKAKEELDQEKPWAEPETSATPEIVSQWAKDNPLLEQAWQANPQLKNQMHALARQNAKLAPLGQIFPNEKSAKFAAETSANWVKVQNAFSNAEINPESIGDAVDTLAEQFMVRDDKGQPVLDADGAPTFHAEWDHTNRFFLDNGLETLLGGIDATKAANGDMQFKSDQDEILFNALTYVKDHIQNMGKVKPPSMDDLTPAQRAWQERMNAEIAEERRKLGLDTQKQKLEGKGQERELHEKQVANDTGAIVGRRLDQILKDKESAGIYIPSYVLAMKDPESGISAFAKGCIDDFLKEVKSVSYYDGNFKALQRKPPTEATRKERADLVTEAVDEFLPRVVDKRLKEAQTSDKADREKRKQSRTQAEQNGQGAVIEPRGGAAPRPGTGPGNDQQQYDVAWEYVNKNFPDLSAKERSVKALEIMHSKTRR